MRPLRVMGLTALLTVGGVSSAGALPMDPALSRLVVDPACVASGAPAACQPDRAAYHKLVSQLGFALAPGSVHEARTTGSSGFEVSLLAAFTSIDQGADYWRRGTRGGEGAAPGSAVELNTDPEALLQLYSLEVRKGLGFGVELAGSVGVMPHASLVSWGADLRVALLEGMRHGAWRYLPDTSVGVGLREVTGLGDLELGTLALDGRLSRPLVGSSGYVLTPWIGYQWVRISGEAAPVDLTPQVDAFGECDYTGRNVPGVTGSAASGAPAGVFDGSPVCSSGSGADFANVADFGAANVARHRLLLGVGYRRDLLKLGAEVLTDIVPPADAQSDDETEAALRCDGAAASCTSAPRQWTVVLRVGAAF